MALLPLDDVELTTPWYHATTAMVIMHLQQCELTLNQLSVNDLRGHTWTDRDLRQKGGSKKGLIWTE